MEKVEGAPPNCPICEKRMYWNGDGGYICIKCGRSLENTKVVG